MVSAYFSDLVVLYSTSLVDRVIWVIWKSGVIWIISIIGVIGVVWVVKVIWGIGVFWVVI